MSRAGDGFADLFVTRSGVHYVLETKSRTGKLTKAQREFHRKHAPVHVVRTVEDALRAVDLLK